jgi:dihydrofolate reductase
LKIIVACTENRVIGCKGKIPWYCPEDMKLFRKLTKWHYVLMGRKTWDSLPIRPLKNRYSIVLSSNVIEYPKNKDTTFIKNLDEVKAIWNYILCIGGGAVYKEVLDKGLVDEIWMSVMKKEYDGDVWFPELSSKWHVTERGSYDEFEFRRLKCS